ncbi:DUF5977 domain-containing protein, partial [Rubrolithibacter danxiaensis]|uniref:DUF5977 domain-containing protein n=1 Tax=Rubrolithibacter danxiaensis TaxID=3390805 RepID=UPI003BF78317
GMTSRTDEKGQTTYYEYDDFQRLAYIKDQYGNILKAFCYHYANSTDTTPCTGTGLSFSNVEKTGSFQKNDCPAGYSSGPAVSYTVPGGKYFSATSQEDADAQALADLNTNGQINANTNGTCTQLYYNVEKTASITKNNCSGGLSGSTVTYTVAASQYSSSISQEDADAKAQNDIDLNGQAYANTNGTCLTAVNVTLTNNTQVNYHATFSKSTGEEYGFDFGVGTQTIQVPEGTYSINIYPPSAYPATGSITVGSTTVSQPRHIFDNIEISTGGANNFISVNEQ